MTEITPVILAGGIGTRLWPISRKNYPKQFSKIFGDRTLFQETLSKFSGSDEVEFNDVITLTNSEFRFIVAEQIEEINMRPGPILIEPSSKNTAPAILAATLKVMEKDNDGILIVTPSDQIVPDKQEFLKALRVAKDIAEEGKLVTFGVKPTRPETGFGYLELADPISMGPQDLVRFIEKPDKPSAESMLQSNNFLWNAGIFVFRASDMYLAFQKYCGDLIEPVTTSIFGAKKDLGFLRLAEKPWDSCINLSIDYAVMEKAKNLSVVPFNSKWSDLGGWNAVWNEYDKDKSGVALSGNATAVDCNNVLLRSEGIRQEIVGIGLQDLIAVAMPDAVLVAAKDRDQEVKNAVAILREKQATQAELFTKDHRPWGWFEILTVGDNFQVKRIMVKPGASLSLQSHNFRSENWVVVSGKARVTVNEDIKYVCESQSVYIPARAKHRLENDTENQLIIIEVQSGSYLGEDDIIRYEDQFNRL